MSALEYLSPWVVLALCVLGGVVVAAALCLIHRRQERRYHRSLTRLPR